jgi:dCMP deaminase
MPRPSWDEYFMSIAEQVAGRSTCLRRQTGAVLVKDRRILSTGYNGTPAGLAPLRGGRVLCASSETSPRVAITSCAAGIHAEQNAVIQAAKHGITIDGSTVYSTHQPCVALREDPASTPASWTSPTAIRIPIRSPRNSSERQVSLHAGRCDGGAERVSLAAASPLLIGVAAVGDPGADAAGHGFRCLSRMGLVDRPDGQEGPHT